MTFDDWWDSTAGKQCQDDSLHMSEYHIGSTIWNAAQRELLLELTKAKMDGTDTVIAAEIQRVKNFKSLL